MLAYDLRLRVPPLFQVVGIDQPKDRVVRLLPEGLNKRIDRSVYRCRLLGFLPYSSSTHQQEVPRVARDRKIQPTHRHPPSLAKDGCRSQAGKGVRHNLPKLPTSK